MENINVLKPVTVQETMSRLKPIVAKVLRIPQMQLDEGTPLINYGINSLMTFVLIQKINKHFGFLSLQEEMSINLSLNALAQLIYKKLNAIQSEHDAPLK